MDIDQRLEGFQMLGLLQNKGLSFIFFVIKVIIKWEAIIWI